MARGAADLRHGLYLAPFGPLADPHTPVEVADAAEEARAEAVFPIQRPRIPLWFGATTGAHRPVGEGSPDVLEHLNGPAWIGAAAGAA